MNGWPQRARDSGSAALDRTAVTLVADYLSAAWRSDCYDCWEEFGDGQHAGTYAAVAAGLAAAAELLDEPRYANVAHEVRTALGDTFVRDGRLRKGDKDDRIDASLLWCALPFGLFTAGRSGDAGDRGGRPRRSAWPHRRHLPVRRRQLLRRRRMDPADRVARLVRRGHRQHRRRTGGPGVDPAHRDDAARPARADDRRCTGSGHGRVMGEPVGSGRDAAAVVTCDVPDHVGGAQRRPDRSRLACDLASPTRGRARATRSAGPRTPVASCPVRHVAAGPGSAQRRDDVGP